MYKIQHITGCFPKYSSFTSFNKAVLHSKVNIRLLFSHLLLWLKISQTCFFSGLRVEQWIFLFVYLFVLEFVCFGIWLAVVGVFGGNTFILKCVFLLSVLDDIS